MIELIMLILWWMAGGFDWVTESWNDFMYSEINRLIELNNDYLEFLKLKENILNFKNSEIIKYENQIVELTKENNILKFHLKGCNEYILKLEDDLNDFNQAYEIISEEDININNK